MSRNVAVLTGAAGGLGQAILSELLSREWLVFAVVRKVSQERELFERNPAQIIPVRADVGEDSIESVLRDTLAAHTKHVSLLIHCAGGGASGYGIENLSLSELSQLINVHCFGSIRCIKACLPFLKAEPGATILNISSRFGSLGWVSDRTLPSADATYPYRIAKAAMNMLTACIASEFDASEIRALSVDPGKLFTRFGPKDADMQPEAAASAILKLLESPLQKSGMFVNNVGEQIPW